MSVIVQLIETNLQTRLTRSDNIEHSPSQTALQLNEYQCHYSTYYLGYLSLHVHDKIEVRRRGPTLREINSCGKFR